MIKIDLSLWTYPNFFVVVFVNVSKFEIMGFGTCSIFFIGIILAFRMQYIKKNYIWNNPIFDIPQAHLTRFSHIWVWTIYEN